MATKNAETTFIAGMGEAPQDRENGANMAQQYREAGEAAEKENAEREDQLRAEAAARPRVALGTGEAIAMGVRAGESPTEGDRPEGWEFVSEDVAKVAKVAGQIAEVRAEGDAEVEAAQAKADAAVADAVAEAELGAYDDGPTVAYEADPTKTDKSDK